MKALKALTQQQYDEFWRDGFLVVDNAVTRVLLQRLQKTFDDWVSESCAHAEPYGTTINDQPRFDLEVSHCVESPALRRVNAPIEISESYYEVMASSRMTDCVNDLIGPNSFHHSRLIQVPGGNTEVKWHQDFTFMPHTNDDVVTALLMVDDVTPENGPPEVAPGSHRDLAHLWHNGFLQALLTIK